MRALRILQFGANATILQQHVHHVLVLLGREAKEANLLALEGLQPVRLGEVLLRGVELQRIAIRPGGIHPGRTNHRKSKGFGVPEKGI